MSSLDIRFRYCFTDLTCMVYSIIHRKRRLPTSASDSDSGTPVSESKQGVKVGYAAVSQVQD